MKSIRILALCSIFLAMLANGTTWAAGKQETIKGYVIDSSCTFTQDLNKPISAECAVACAKAGSPLVIQGEKGTIYLPISGGMPATGQNDRLIAFAGQKVSVTGKVYVKGGAHAIVIDKIEGAPKP